ncbi:MAG: UDP-N-acetylmuramoyl-L-alanyl-D-glutamate--2,6-diaminopimelate ligase [Aristaeellaceae bacterium]
MKLCTLFEKLPYLVETRGNMVTEISALCSDSRKKPEANSLFFCVPGATFDAHNYAPQAVENGCVALVVDHFVDVDVPQVKVTSVRAAMSRMAATFYGHPAEQMRLVGVTGTKGKTTTTYMMKSILETAGMKVGLIGTTGNMIGSQRIASNYTTPDPLDLQRDLRAMADAGVQAVVMEVSAHAIDMCRLDGLSFEVGAYTNLSQDHLDYFGTMENYFECKKRFFTGGMVRNAVLNVDEETSADILRDLTVPHVTFGIAAAADLFARDIEISENGVSFELKLQGMHALPIALRMTGMFNVYNAIAAASCAMVMGISHEDIKAGLEKIENVPGRIEMLPTHTPYRMILDYAHAPDALDNILRTCRTFTRGRLIAVFGCGGDRDKGKRPIMGRIGGELADLCILTSDNPRNEDPMAILNAIEEGIKETACEYVVIENRRAAIRHAMEIGRPGDVIALCGKGHETYQEIRGVKHPFDEKVVVAELLAELDAE